jgi:inhibitor of KinA
MPMTFSALGDSAVVATLGDEADEATMARVRALAAAIGEAHAPGILEVVPAYGAVTVIYDPVRFASAGTRPYPTVCQLIAWCEARMESESAAERDAPAAPREVEIPVCYGGEFGPDLAQVAAHCGLDAAEVVARHSGAGYLVNAVGFVPGFPYLGGLPETLRVPRRPTPRTNVPAGSVGIGGAQTGIYPMSTPGGWHLIGRTPLALFRPAEEIPCLLHMGDRVRIRGITAEEFAAWK